MAKAKPQKRKSRKKSGKRGSFSLLLLLLCVGVLGLMVVAAPALILLSVGMAPTLVAMFIDRDPQKYAAISVAALNFAGLSPYLVEFLFGNADVSRAIELVSNVFVLVVIYGAASAGWVLVLFLPPVAAIVIRGMSDNRIQSARKAQRQLIEEWGPDVASR